VQAESCVLRLGEAQSLDRRAMAQNEKFLLATWNSQHLRHGLRILFAPYHNHTTAPPPLIEYQK